MASIRPSRISTSARPSPPDRRIDDAPAGNQKGILIRRIRSSTAIRTAIPFST